MPDGFDLSYRLVIFDMDGTLADSFPWFVRHVNAVADRFAFRRIAPDEVATLRRLDASRILERLDIPRWKLPLIARHMRALKAQHSDEIALFPGVERMLRQLKDAGAVLAIVSSDAESNVRRTLGADTTGLVDHYACGASLFGKRIKFTQVLRRSGVGADDAIAIGDELRDAEAARRAGIAFGAVAWGYTSIDALQAVTPAHVFFNLDEIATKLARSR
jgi:phosphoglycolate phosphatase